MSENVLRFSLRSCFFLWSSAFFVSVSPMVTPTALLESTNISLSFQLSFLSLFFCLSISRARFSYV